MDKIKINLSKQRPAIRRIVRELRKERAMDMTKKRILAVIFLMAIVSLPAAGCKQTESQVEVQQVYQCRDTETGKYVKCSDACRTDNPPPGCFYREDSDSK